MKRRSFFAALAAVVASPSVCVKLARSPVKRMFLAKGSVLYGGHRFNTLAVDDWTFIDYSAGWMCGDDKQKLDSLNG